MISGGQNVGEHSQVHDFLQGLIPVGKLQQVPIGIGGQDIIGLATDPTSHVHITIGAARPVGIDVEADFRLTFLTVPATPTGNIERHRHQITDLDELDVGTDLDDLTGDFVAKDQAFRGRSAPTDHVLVRSADIGRHGPQNGSVGNFPADVGRVHPRSVLELELRIVGVDNFDDARPLVGHSAIPAHLSAPFTSYDPHTHLFTYLLMVFVTPWLCL